ncbi:Alpha/Beta hydrolase protein [Cokeromyces recurvatus]|uniref:Alpha/Beta hydrolase protein n=1 Tax=Cokeromyces recurvatus TaxID=90255 RepID=UPI00221FD72F|nr:Alpha/Beta hydrolase protein [Cokeromyces recurvatus]KAI7898595.1 Alpha/Beta hydrolase protein [Cokeromyces recurvatus]
MALLSLTQIAHQLRNALLNKANIRKSSTDSNKKSVVLYPRLIKSGHDAIVVTATTTTTTANGLNIPVTSYYIPPRAPIVLCHGLYGFDKLGPDAFPLLQIHYWGGIENALAKLGAKVIVTKVPSTGSIWLRAYTLHQILKSILKEDINFVAHSMGGLDCRYLITHMLDRPYKIKSLTTISTPHRGSPVMDWFRDHIGVGTMTSDAALVAAGLTSKNKNKFLNQFIRLVDTEAYANLSTDYCKHHFNPHTPNDPKVAYYSYGANASFPPWSLLNLPSKWIREKEGENDGLVSVESAKWGHYIKTLDADHWDLNGQRYRWRHTRSNFFSNNTNRFNTIDFYMELATRLYQEGH